MITIPNEKDFDLIIHATNEELKDLFENKGYSADVSTKDGLTPLLYEILNFSNQEDKNAKPISKLYERINILASHMLSFINFSQYANNYVRNVKNLKLSYIIITGQLDLPQYLNKKNLERYFEDNPSEKELILKSKISSKMTSLMIPSFRWEKERFYYLKENGFPVDCIKTGDLNILYGNYSFEIMKELMESGISLNPAMAFNFIHYKLMLNINKDSFLEEIKYLYENRPELLDFLVNKNDSYRDIFENMHMEDFKYVYQHIMVPNITQEHKEALALNGKSINSDLIKAVSSNYEKINFLLEQNIDLNEVVDSRYDLRLYHVLFEELIKKHEAEIALKLLSRISLKDLTDIEKPYLIADSGNSYRHIFFELLKIIDFDKIKKYLFKENINLNYKDKKDSSNNIILNYPNEIKMIDFLIGSCPEKINDLKKAYSEDGYSIMYLLSNIISYNYYTEELKIDSPNDISDYYHTFNPAMASMIDKKILDKQIKSQEMKVMKRI